MKIKDILAKGQPTLSFEVFPPKEESSRFRLSAVRETWERRCAGSRKVLR